GYCTNAVPRFHESLESAVDFVAGGPKAQCARRVEIYFIAKQPTTIWAGQRIFHSQKRKAFAPRAAAWVLFPSATNIFEGQPGRHPTERRACRRTTWVRHEAQAA